MKENFNKLVDEFKILTKDNKIPLHTTNAELIEIIRRDLKGDEYKPIISKNSKLINTIDIQLRL